MANLVITSDISRVSIVFNDYSSQAGMPSGDWQKTTISCMMNTGNVDVFFLVFNEQNFRFSYNGSAGSMQVDSINGVSPIDNSDLYSKLQTILAEQSNAVFEGLSKITVSTTPPSSPSVGDLWVEIP